MEDGFVIDRPNRRKASSRTTRAIVILLLLVSAALMTIVIVGGWSVLQGGQPIQIAYVILYVGGAYYVGRWNRGVLPVAAALAIILAIFCAVAAPDWFARDKSGFATPETIFGTTGLEAAVCGLLTYLLIPVQILLIFFAMQGFRQDWHVEVEVHVGRRSGGAGGTGRGLPAGA